MLAEFRKYKPEIELVAGLLNVFDTFVSSIVEEDTELEVSTAHKDTTSSTLKNISAVKSSADAKQQNTISTEQQRAKKSERPSTRSDKPGNELPPSKSVR